MGKLRLLLRHLKLEDSDGINTLLTIEIFEQLALMGFFIIAVQTPGSGISILLAVETPSLAVGTYTGSGNTSLEGEGSTVLVESHHTPTYAPSTSQPHFSPTLRIPIRQEIKVPQPSSIPLTNVANETASIGVDVRHKRAATTITSLDVGQSGGDINKTPSIPYDLPLPRVHTLGSDEGRIQHNELMDLVTKLSDRVVALETDLKQTKKVYDAAYTKLIMKGRKIDEIDQDPNISLIQHDAEIQGRYDQDMEFNLNFDAAKEVSTTEKEVSTAEPVSTSGAAVTTASIDISPARPTRRVSTTDDIAMAETLVNIRRSAAKDKGKDIMTESKPIHTKTKLQQEQEILGYEAAVRLKEELD
nr:hypothetical protein [Tanacetum cinerariifolium]